MVGETVVNVVVAPVLHVYDVAPLAVKLTVVPAQAVGELADILTVGPAITAIEMVCVSLHEFTAVPVAV